MVQAWAQAAWLSVAARSGSGQGQGWSGIYHAVPGGTAGAGSTWWGMWDARPAVVIVLGCGLGAYVLGWRRLRRAGHARLASTPRLAAYAAGVSALVVALLGPLDALQESSFTLHMVQHLVLKMVAPPLIWLGMPYAIGLWGLPSALRARATSVLARRAGPRKAIGLALGPWTALILCMGALYLWHVPAAYEAVFASTVLHDVEHVTFFGAAMLFWWHVTGAAPHFHGRLGFGRRLAMVLVAMALNTALGIALGMSSEVLYPHYAQVVNPMGLQPLADQQLGGAIMWIPGGMMYALAAIALLARMLGAEERAACAAEAGVVIPVAR